MAAEFEAGRRKRVRETDLAFRQRAEEQGLAIELETAIAVGEYLGWIGCHVLLVNGALDMPGALISAEAIRARIPGTQAEAFPNAAHLPGS